MTAKTPSPVYLLPTKDQIERLQVGDTAINAYGGFTKVVEVFARGVDVHGKAFCCYYTQDEDSDTKTSMSMHEGQLCRTLRICSLHTASELREIEHYMKALAASMTLL